MSQVLIAPGARPNYSHTTSDGTRYVSDATGHVTVTNLNHLRELQAVGFGAANLNLDSSNLTVSATSTAAAGTTAGTAAALPSGGGIYNVTGASGTNGVILAAADKVQGRQIEIANLSTSALLIYPPNGGTINGLAANAGFTTTAGMGARLSCISATLNQWSGLS